MFPDLITVFLDSCWIFHLQQQILVHYTPLCLAVVKTYFLPYIIMVIGAHDSKITIKNGGNAIYGATLVIPSLVPRPHLISITLRLILLNLTQIS